MQTLELFRGSLKIEVPLLACNRSYYTGVMLAGLCQLAARAVSHFSRQ
jgi:hypothetical protein